MTVFNIGIDIQNLPCNGLVFGPRTSMNFELHYLRLMVKFYHVSNHVVDPMRRLYMTCCSKSVATVV